MKRFGIIVLCLLIACTAAGCKKDAPQQESSVSDTSADQKLSQEEYESIASIFRTQYQDLMEQLQAMLASYAGNDDWHNGFNTLYNQAKNAEAEFTANKDKIPSECVEEYNALMNIVNSYNLAMTKVQQAHHLNGNDQQQSLNEAAQILMQANLQWRQIQGEE